jgi:hypothetical protein
MLDAILTFTLGLFFGILIGAFVAMGVSQPNKLIIKHGCAQYNHVTGDFEWIKVRKDD